MEQHGTVSVVDSQIVFVADDGEIQVVDLNDWHAFGIRYGEIGVSATQAIVDHIRFEVEKQMLLTGSRMEAA
jgi:hypothetical protein